MAVNAGNSPDIILAGVLKQKAENGYDFASGMFVNMIESGIVDPVKVSRTALQNAASAASTLLTTNYAIIEI
jgi:chaperonin GroEL